jgi:hypothetical protein
VADSQRAAENGMVEDHTDEDNDATSEEGSSNAFIITKTINDHYPRSQRAGTEVALIYRTEYRNRSTV